MARRNRPLIIFLLLLGLVLVLAGTSIYFYRKYNRISLDTVSATQAETRALIEEVGKLIYLPQDEIPTVATVSEPEKLKNQAFFVDAQIGHKVLIYTNAKKAILYDPGAKKIVNVAPINLGTSPQGTTGTAEIQTTP